MALSFCQWQALGKREIIYYISWKLSALLYSCFCQGVVATLAGSTVRLPVYTPTSSSKEAALAWAHGGFPLGEWRGRSSTFFLTLTCVQKNGSVQCSLKDLGFSGAAKAVHKMNFYCQMDLII